MKSILLIFVLLASNTCTPRPVYYVRFIEGKGVTCTAPQDGHLYICVCEPKAVRVD